MSIDIHPYEASRDYDLLIQLIESEGEEWADIIAPEKLDKYQLALKNSITYVAYCAEDLCGYIRSIDDQGLDVFVLELLVHREFRGRHLGKQLLDQTCEYFKDRAVFVLSDSDGYYKKLDYKYEGSIFKVT